MNDLYAVGEMVIDFIPGSEEASYIRKAGGAPANVAIAAAKNGLNSAMCCKVGEDNFGHFLMDTLAKYNVEAVCKELSKEAVTTMAFVTLSANGERVFTFARKPGADMMLSESDVKEDDIKNSIIVHAGSCSLSAQPEKDATIKAMRLAKEHHKLVSFDVNYRNIMWNDDVDACVAAIKDVLQYVDLLKLSGEEIDMMGGEAALPQLMKDYNIAVIVETLGADGAKAFFNGGTVQVPGQRVHAVDATGCGDAFWGAFLSKLRLEGVEKISDIHNDLIRTAMNYGNISGCICVQSKGAIESIPTRKQIEEYIRKNNIAV
ncbi:MAG: carbohydrate kinase [Synergistaceae bacterium]|nr:carbohydrate kinase [Synergistaceae bacterium]